MREGNPCVVAETPAEFFKSHVESALAKNRVRAGDLTAFYLVNLLCRKLRFKQDGPDDERLTCRFISTLIPGKYDRSTRLRSIGDSALFNAGFFADRIDSRGIKIDHYVAIGQRVYSELADDAEESYSDMFTELSDKFVDFIDVLEEVRAQTIRTPTSLIRAYERWLRTGSARSARTLIAHGIEPREAIRLRIQ